MSARKTVGGAGELVLKKCQPCEVGAVPLGEVAVAELLGRTEGWEPRGIKEIGRKFKFRSFREAMDFVARVAELAESEGHHPDIHIFYNRVELVLSTHAIGGLSENDFILAAKISELH